ncbi:MAG: hypothetical protein ACRCXT_11525 [Paraclostridium sp.]
MNKNKTTIEIKGLKCDNPNCDYRDDDIPYKDYKRYINKGCPKCGMVLLTRKEYLICKFLTGVVRLANKIFKNQGDMKTVNIDIVDQDRFKGGK